METNVAKPALEHEAVTRQKLVADLKVGDGCTDRLDLSGQLHAEDLLLRSAQADEVANEERLRGSAGTNHSFRQTSRCWKSAVSSPVLFALW